MNSGWHIYKLHKLLFRINENQILGRYWPKAGGWGREWVRAKEKEKGTEGQRAKGLILQVLRMFYTHFKSTSMPSCSSFLLALVCLQLSSQRWPISNSIPRASSTITCWPYKHLLWPFFFLALTCLNFSHLLNASHFHTALLMPGAQNKRKQSVHCLEQ